MDPYELPDLSDWRLVEVWTIEEAALLWAAINPMDHMGRRLHDLRPVLAPAQYSKACIFQRAIIEGVCGGTLPFKSAWEERPDYQSSYEKEVEFPELPEPSYILPHMTRISQAAFIKWTQGKKMWSVRQQLQRVLPAQAQSRRSEVFDAENTIEMQSPTKPLALPLPSYLDPTHPWSPAELVAAHDAWLAVTQDGNPKSSGTAVRAAMMKFLNTHPTHRTLGSAAKERICTVANWDKKGGATRTPSGKG